LQAFHALAGEREYIPILSRFSSFPRRRESRTGGRSLSEAEGAPIAGGNPAMCCNADWIPGFARMTNGQSAIWNRDAADGNDAAACQRP